MQRQQQQQESMQQRQMQQEEQFPNGHRQTPQQLQSSETQLNYDEFERSRQHHMERQQLQEQQSMKAEKIVNQQHQHNQSNNTSIRAGNGNMQMRTDMANQQANAMRSSTGKSQQLSSLDDILGMDDSPQAESLQNTIQQSVQPSGAQDIMALAQQMQNARDEPTK